MGTGPMVSVDCTGATTVAVLRHEDGRVEPLLFDASPHLPSGVFRNRHRLIAGRRGLDAAAAFPDQYVPVPARLLTASGGPASDNGQVEDCLAASLRVVAGQAATTAGQRVTEAVIVVPPGWGPQRRTRMRVAAERAGIHPHPPGRCRDRTADTQRRRPIPVQARPGPRVPPV